MDTELRKKGKNEFGKDSYNLMNKCVFKKAMENLRKQRDIKVVTRDKKKKKEINQFQNLTIIQQNGFQRIC